MPTIEELEKAHNTAAAASVANPTEENKDKANEALAALMAARMAEASKSDTGSGRRRRQKTRKARKTRRGGRTMPVDAALMKEMKAKHEKDLKKTGIDMRKKISEIANELKARGSSLGGLLLTTLSASEDGVEDAKAILSGFFSNVPEVPDTTRKSMGGSTRKSRR